MRVSPEGIFFEGIRFYDDNNEIIADKEWGITQNDKWIDQAIPEETSIIGIKANTAHS